MTRFFHTTIPRLRPLSMKTLLTALTVLAVCSLLEAQPSAPSAGIRKIGDVTIYQDARFHCAFPSIVRRPDGELLVAFRRAPDRRLLGEARYTHTDPNSYLVMVRSGDSGKTWTKEPQLIYAHPFGGSQDPCMVQLRDESIVCTSYAWAWASPALQEKLKQPVGVHAGGFVFLGGYLLQSADGGHTWGLPIVPPSVPGERQLDIFGKPLPACNRGAMCEGADGRLYWVVIRGVDNPKRVETHLLISGDKGRTWKYSCPVAQDAKATFSETSLYETPKGDLVAFMRTENFDDRLCIARSHDHGRSFDKWTDSGFRGHPSHAVRLPDGRVLLVYGYRHPPYGIRARVLDSECTNIASAPEVILREDGGGVDLGYPWAVVLSEKRAFVVYYFNQNDGPRTIQGTFVEID